MSFSMAKNDNRWYLAVRCEKCQLPILFALDRIGGTDDVPPQTTAKLVLTCGFEQCKHRADYTGATVLRFQKEPPPIGASKKNDYVSKARVVKA